MVENRHKCPGPGCQAMVPYRHLACIRHWRQVPGDLQAEVNALWWAGGVSPEYLEARRAAVDSMRSL